MIRGRVLVPYYQLPDKGSGSCVRISGSQPRSHSTVAYDPIITLTLNHESWRTGRHHDHHWTGTNMYYSKSRRAGICYNLVGHEDDLPYLKTNDPTWPTAHAPTKREANTTLVQGYETLPGLRMYSSSPLPTGLYEVFLFWYKVLKPRSILKLTTEIEELFRSRILLS